VIDKEISNLNPNVQWRCEKKGADIQCLPSPRLDDTHQTPAPGKGMRRVEKWIENGEEGKRNERALR